MFALCRRQASRGGRLLAYVKRLTVTRRRMLHEIVNDFLFSFLFNVQAMLVLSGPSKWKKEL